ncbi:hypothetical protein [uncultured Alistipes sp.]|uniref:hypothetical protein n=1 Tax=uncultured Alistipes sp. TaxID=538949 RepID=UPI0026706E01|nr:hypothetical protein [uncultured Alistipes sp.]
MDLVVLLLILCCVKNFYMQYFFISGAPSTGKTTTINAVCGWLQTRGYSGRDVDPYGRIYSPITTYLASGVQDFSYMLYKGEFGVLVHSATDDQPNIDILVGLIHNLTPDVVITSCRDYPDWPREYLCQTLGLTNDYELNLSNSNVREFPLAKITRRKNWNDPYIWYFRNTTNIIEDMLMAAPYNL